MILCGFSFWVKYRKLYYLQEDSWETVQFLQIVERLSSKKKEQWLSVVGINEERFQGSRFSYTSPSEILASSLVSHSFLFCGPPQFSIFFLFQDHKALSIGSLQLNPGATHRVRCGILSSLLFCCWFSVTKLYLSLHDSITYSMPGSSVLHYLPEFAQTHVHRVSDAI